MFLRASISSLCLALAMPASALAQQGIDTSTLRALAAATAGLPCPGNVEQALRAAGYSRTQASGSTEEDYADVAFTRPDGGATVLFARERTPLGFQFSLSVEFPVLPGEDAGLAAEIERAFALAPEARLHPLADGSQQWSAETGSGKIVLMLVRSNGVGHLIGQTAPIKPGSKTNC